MEQGTDFSTGKVTKVTDADNSASTTTSYDVFGRPLAITDAMGEVTTIAYKDADRYQTVTAPLDSSGGTARTLYSVTCFDEGGAVTPCAAGTEIHSSKSYRYSGGRYEWTSNPMRSGD